MGELHIYVKGRDVEKIATCIRRAYPDGFEVRVLSDVIVVSDSDSDYEDRYEFEVGRTHVRIICPGSAEDSWPYIISELLDEFGWENVKWMKG